MPKAGFIVARISFLVLAASMLGVAMLAVPASGQTSTCSSSSKCFFAVTVSPSNPAAGVSTSFTFTIRNEASPQQLGSVQISAPAGFVITGASGAASFTSSSALFLNLSLAPSATTTLTLTASAQCSAGAYQWGIAAKQANNFNGSGNDFQLDPASAGNLMGTSTESLSLAFTSEPTDTAVGAVITSKAGSSGGPVTVEVLNGCGQLATTSSAEVTVGIGPNSGPGTLSGMVMVAASGGIASFSDLTINQPGGYTLVAMSPGITSATSAGFTIFGGSVQPCSSSTCSTSASSATTSGTVTTSSAMAGDFIATEMEGANSSFSFTCRTYTAVSDVFRFAVFDAHGDPLSIPLTVTLRTDKSLVESSGHPGASSWQICYASTSPFTVRPGTTSGTATIGGVTYQTGLLPDCSSTQVAPCVQARNKNNAGDVIVTFPAFGDPLGHD
jgi:hypothetical protein